ncbi:MAG: hypothetical protein UX57_C0005G0081 [Candidatus Uhrbacteria bacterium GW2011_GWE2_46_68]|uniref:Uncharacterized protein n=1 Tax=Candidatus Uhrbacteria bacterium GW2011_GWE2_46_68 TaxID=1618994 RepID=A0A0G1Q883_9BACT|nr:MAG: hypothetical protein UX57_C0005G0081 [Candidatus Uhrbacteria bacterium GW2011_GWE2_46_68]
MKAKDSNEYLSILQKAQEDKDSPYHGETGLTSEDWIIAFMTHLSETRQPLDNYENNKESISFLTGAFFLSSSAYVPCACWRRAVRRVFLDGGGPRARGEDIGLRFSVMI